MMNFQLLLALALVSLSQANVYLHNPRGSNNRYDEENSRNRQETNRLFWSRNGANGGYNWGPPMYYFTGSKLRIEWTQLHGSTPEQGVNSDVILQYMCSDNLRDGQTTQRIPATMEGAMMRSAGGQYEYGMHENWEYYQACNMRNRNEGLYIGDRILGNGAAGLSAMYTRSNPSGARGGLECNEEREYYPYWHPTPWRDIAIITSDTSKCTNPDAYSGTSQNVVNKGWCSDMEYGLEDTCPQAAGWSLRGKWGIAAPECIAAEESRRNHMGNVMAGVTNSYEWTIPDDPHPSCVLRIRYNVTDNSIPWNTDHTSNGYEKALVKQDPFVKCGNDVNCSLALDSRMYGGSVHEDRSHRFQIIARPEGVKNKIHNLNVRGRRGNIVQTFPAVEYDFVPTTLDCKENEWIHFQWTGADSNNQNDAGEGQSGTDRSNVVEINGYKENFPKALAEVSLFSPEEAIRMASSGLDPQSDCDTKEEIIQQSADDDDEADEDARNCAKLNPPSADYFDGGLQPCPSSGIYYYMSTRNNNFSNRSQKGIVRSIPCPEGDADCSNIDEVEAGFRFVRIEGSGAATLSVTAIVAFVAAAVVF